VDCRQGSEFSRTRSSLLLSLAPQMSADNKARPPIETPEPNKSGLPTIPIQPASVKGCANRRAKKEAGEPEMVKDVYPSGTSPH
jgi:hypothetical protein